MKPRSAHLACIALVLGALAPTTAFAGTAGLNGTKLEVTAAPGEVNNLTVTQTGPNLRVEDTGSGVALSPSPGCTDGGNNIVLCPSAAVLSLRVAAGNGDDRVANSTSYPSSLLGEADDDRLVGGSAADTLDGGSGSDLFFGQGASDTFIGGSEPDYASYSDRSVPITADTDGVADDGILGENDNVGTDVETLIGGSAADTLTGNEIDNGLDGGPGADTLNGGPGNDYVLYWTRSQTVSVSFDGVANDGETGENDVLGPDLESAIGGNGADTITGDARANTLIGGNGNDVIVGAGGADTLSGSSGTDYLDGGTEDDLLDGGDQADTMYGREGMDRVSYATRTSAVTVDPDEVADDGALSEGDNVHSDVENLTGGSGADTLTGSVAANVLEGGAGNDQLAAGAGDDTLTGGAGADTLNGGDDTDVLDGGTEADVMNGGAGVDRATYAGRSAPVIADLEGDEDDGESGEADSIGADVEKLAGGSANDDLRGNPGGNALEGGPGDDSLSGGPGSDDLFGGDGADTLGGGTEGDFLDGGSQNDTVNGDDGADTLLGADADDSLNGGEGADTLRGDAGADRLDGGGGDDALEGGADNDVLAGLFGADRLDGGSGADTLDGGPDSDRLDGGGGPDNLNGGDGVDELSYASRVAGLGVDLDGQADDGEGAEGDNAHGDIENLVGGAGADTLTGDDHPNLILSGAGNDILDGGLGEDKLDSGAGADNVKARDKVIDQVNCGTEQDSVVSDPNDAVRTDCEGNDTGELRAADRAADRAKPKVSGAPVSVGADGVARILVACPAGRSSPCRGTVALTLLEPQKTTKKQATSSRRSRRTRPRVPSGKKKFSVASGKSAPIAVTLSRNGRRRVMRERKVRCSVNVAIDVGGGKKVETRKTIIIRAARRSRRR